jgi:DNA-binding GntR family transcriptional regulator
LETLRIVSLKDKAYRMIREMIINCTLTPGTLINEKELIELIGVSRTPIREALSRLEHENLVRIVPQRGVFVTELTVKNIEDLCEIREIAEPYFARTAAINADINELKQFEDFFMHALESDYETVIKTDRHFHRYVASFSKNAYLIQMMKSVYAQNERLRMLSCRVPSRVAAAAEEHLNIIRAMLQRDADGASEAMKIHMVNSRTTAFKMNSEAE